MSNLSTSVLSLLTAAILSGCATHLEESKPMRDAWSAGDYTLASASAVEMANEYVGTADALVWKLNEGSTARAAGNIDGSMKAFETAYAMVQTFDADSEIDLGAETKALVTNLSYLPYKGYSYDRIMLGVYQAMNCMQSGDVNGAAVMLKRVENFQSDAESKNAARIQKELDEAAKLSGKKVDSKTTVYDANRAMKNSQFASAIEREYGTNATKFSGVRGDYVNPFAYWLDGVYFMACHKTQSDRARAADSFRILSTLVQNEYVAQDVEVSKAVAAGGEMPDTTYVVFSTGSAPVRKQVRIDIPVFIATKDVPYVGVNFPKLELNGSYTPTLAISANGISYQPSIVADMDKIIAREFYDELPLVIAKTLLSAGTKAALQYGLQESVRAAGDDGAGLLAMMIVGTIYQVAMNNADLRTWTTLPKQIKIARIPTPADRRLRIGSTDVALADARANFVCVTKPSATAAMSIKTFALGKR